MRTRIKNGPLSVHAIAGSYVVMLGINMSERASRGVLGFAIERIDHTNHDRHDWLEGLKVFPGTANTFGRPVSTHKHPIQGFLWSDFTVRQGHRYSYRVLAMRGTAGALIDGEETTVTIDLEATDQGDHAIFFNRGVAGSQAYARRFKNKLPSDFPDNRAWTWLSRGLEEALLGFIEQAENKRFAIRGAFYEFHYPPVLAALKAASERGVDVQLVYDGRKNGQNYPNQKNREAIAEAGLGALVTARTKTPSYIAHNKFMVLLKDGKPRQVWTGSTNLTRGGIFGQSNVGHLVRESKVAAHYLRYWQVLHGDPAAPGLRTWNEGETTIPQTVPVPGTTLTIFSPRQSLHALEWYTKLMDESLQPVFLTAAFGVNDWFADVLAQPRDYLRYVLLESEDNDMDRLKRVPTNRIAVGNVVGNNGYEQWLTEQVVPGLNNHVRYIHTKYMLINPLGQSPIVISGSANFSVASTKNNDENMLVIRGNKRVADIYLGEFMRLFRHYYFRYIISNFRAPDAVTGTKGSLAPDDSWRTGYYQAGSAKFMERTYFA